MEVVASKNENEEWHPRKLSCWDVQESSSESADVEEGMSIDDSHQSSTNLSVEENKEESEAELQLESIELVNTMNRSPRSSSYRNGSSRPAPIQIELGNMEDITNKPGRRRNMTNGDMNQKTSPTKAPEGALGPVSPDPSKDSQDSLLKDESSIRKKSIRFSPTNEIRHFTPNPDEFEENPYSTNPYMSCGRTSRLFLVVYALPFMHGASSNITTLYLLVELSLRYEINSFVVGGYLALAYISRLSLALLSRFVPKTCVLIGSTMAYFGFGLIFISQNSILLQNFGVQGKEFLLFLIGSILANTNEMTSAMQVFVREQLTHNVKEMGQKLKRHYLIAKLARVASFGGGGVVYHYYGVAGLALMGGSMVSLQIMCLGIFFILDIYREVLDHSNGLYGEMKPPKRFALDCSIRAAIGRRRLLSSSMSSLTRTLGKYYPTTMPSKIVHMILPICVYGRTIASIIVWNAIAYIMRTDFDQNYLVIGGVFAGIMVCDFIMSIVTLSDGWNAIIKTNLPPPQDIYLLTIGLTLSLALVAVPNFIAFILGLVIYICFNNAMRTLLLELKGTNDSMWDNFQFHLIRCASTAIALFSLPVLNEFHRRLSLVLAIWFALLTSAVLVYVINVKITEEDESDELDRKRRNALSTARSGRISRRPEKNLIYGEQIMLSRMIKGKEI